MPENQPMPVAEWLAEGRRRFGDDYKLWKFRCPVCGHVQTPGEFGAIGQEPQSAYQECIGRHLQFRASNFAGTPGKNGEKSPCDYAAYGLFQFGWKVINERGKPVPVFPFADFPPQDSIASSDDGLDKASRPGESPDAGAKARNSTGKGRLAKAQGETDAE